MAAYDVVIPARDEAGTVGAVVQAARGAAGVGTVLVVDDGSADGTAEAARGAGAVVVAARPPGSPKGDKGRALAAGVAAARADVLVFFDADLAGARPAHFEALAAPVLAGACALSCGLLDYGRLRNPLFLRLPPITGLRALPRAVFEAVAPARRNGFRIEIMLNEVVARGRLPARIRVLRGLTHRSKVEKAGWARGARAHLAMTAELLGCLRTVPLWTYGAYLRRLEVLPPAGPGAPRSGPARSAGAVDAPDA